METPRQQGSIFLVPNDQDKPNSLCLLDDIRKEALLGTPRQYRELLASIPDQDGISPYRVGARVALGGYTEILLGLRT